MPKKEISMGVVHDLPKDLEDHLLGDEKSLELWEDLTALGRNEWISGLRMPRSLKHVVVE